MIKAFSKEELAHLKWKLINHDKLTPDKAQERINEIIVFNDSLKNNTDKKHKVYTFDNLDRLVEKKK